MLMWIPGILKKISDQEKYSSESGSPVTETSPGAMYVDFNSEADHTFFCSIILMRFSMLFE